MSSYQYGYGSSVYDPPAQRRKQERVQPSAGALSAGIATLARRGIAGGGSPAVASPGAQQAPQFMSAAAPAAPAAAAAPQTPAQQAAAGTLGSVDKQSFNYDFDPVLAQIRGLADLDVSTAESEALGGRRSLMLGFGSQELAKKMLGEDDPTIAAISDDPDKSTSTLARIAKAYRDKVGADEEAMNQANLFYSGFRGKRLKDLADERTTQTADAEGQVQSALGEIGKALLGARSNARNRVVQAQQDAAFREMMARALAAGVTPPTVSADPTTETADPGEYDPFALAPPGGLAYSDWWKRGGQ